MTPVPQPTALVPSVRVAIDCFLARSRFAAWTRDSYAQDLAPLRAHVGDQRVSALTRGVASAYLAAHAHLAVSTFNRRYAALRSFARWCTTQGWLADDPLMGLERRPQVRGEPRALDPEQVEARLRPIHDTRDRALFWLIYDSALRCREALTIDVDDIDMEPRNGQQPAYRHGHRPPARPLRRGLGDQCLCVPARPRLPQYRLAIKVRRD